MTIFDILKDIVTNKTGTLHLQEDFEDQFQLYVLMGFLSTVPKNLPCCEYINKYGDNVTKVALYKILVAGIPYARTSYLKYPKGVKK